MHKHLLPITIAFMTLSLATFMVRGGSHEVIAFGLSSVLAGFVSYLEHLREGVSNDLRDEMRILRDQVANISVSLGWNK